VLGRPVAAHGVREIQAKRAGQEVIPLEHTSYVTIKLCIDKLQLATYLSPAKQAIDGVMNRRTSMAILGSGLGAAIAAMSAISDTKSGTFAMSPSPASLHALHEGLSGLARRLEHPRWTFEMRSQSAARSVPRMQEASPAAAP
jgi:hypothetical protein